MPDSVIAMEVDFIAELLRWNKRINLTSIRTHAEAIEKHLLDSLVLLDHLDGAKNLLDIGSGGGVPGIPLAIAAPSLQVVSVDSIGKKINFQKHIKRTLQLENLAIFQSRIETLGQARPESEKFDLIVSRAFSSIDTYLGCATPWLKPGGRIIAMKGPEGEEELAAAIDTVEQLGYVDRVIISYKLPFSGATRQLIVLKK